MIKLVLANTTIKGMAAHLCASWDISFIFLTRPLKHEDLF